MRRVRPAGDAALLVQAGDSAAALAAAIRWRGLPGLLEVLPGAGTVLVITEPGSWDLGELAALIGELALPGGADGLAGADGPDSADEQDGAGLPGGARAGPGDGGLVEIPVRYDGADLAEVARLAGLDVAGVIARHQAAVYTVGWLGFSPGFGYLTGLDPALRQVQRLARPRLAVPAGSVAIAGGLAAVYPAASPGGWRLLGRTSARLWDPAQDPPALLAPGMRVRFRAVGRLEPAEPRSSEPVTGSPAGARGHVEARRAEAGHAEAGHVQSVPRGAAGIVMIEVIRPGALATIQDLGRHGFGHLGVPASGAADAVSLRLANRLAGNPDGAAGLEITLGRAVLRFLGAAVVAVTGAPVRLTITAGTGDDSNEGGGTGHDGGESGGRRGFGAAFGVAAGSVLRLGGPAAGLRSYLAVRGGIDGPVVLGSRSADLLSGLGPAPLRAGDLLPVGSLAASCRAGGDRAVSSDWAAGGSGAPAADRAAGGELAASGERVAAPDGRDGRDVTLRVVAGPRDDWLEPGALRLLGEAAYTVTAASNRTALRLDGPPLPAATDAELPSEGMVTGALQVPPDGMPILLLADHPVTGGYPVIAVVATADIPAAAQLRPGQRVRFAVSR